jgi:hypothetical protein
MLMTVNLSCTCRSYENAFVFSVQCCKQDDTNGRQNTTLYALLGPGFHGLNRAYLDVNFAIS